MPEIEFSVMIHTPQTVTILQELLKEFEGQSGIHVHLHPLNWSSAHSELNRDALYHHGPDVSEIGSTWVSDLIAMNALRPFSKTELSQIGKPEEFVAQSWKTGHLIDDDVQWAIPWLAETYVIHYRQDLLQKAGIDEAAAFATHTQFAETLCSLQKSGVLIPAEFPLTLDSFGNLHVLASWVWANGGDFCTPDGKQVLFDQPAAQAAFRTFFGLLRNLSAEARRNIRERDGSLFAQGQSAIDFGTLMLYQNRANAAPEVQKNWRVAPLPGARFMGGSNLVVWKHAHHEKAVLELVRFMTSTSVQTRIALPLATLPPRLAALAAPQIAQDENLSGFAESIRTGRSYHSIPLWGLIEDRLVATLIQIGIRAIADEAVDLDALINQQTGALARRLNTTLAQ